jgi:hypothetical protein
VCAFFRLDMLRHTQPSKLAVKMLDDPAHRYAE